MYNEEELNAFIDYLEDEGVVEWVGMNVEGERTFVFNFDRMSKVFPELYHSIMDDLNNEIIKLYELGFISIEYDKDLVPNFKITESGKKYLSDNGVVIPEDNESI